MIGDGQPRPDRGLRQVEPGEVFGDVPGEKRHPRGLLRIGRIEPQHEAIILHRRAAAGGGDDDRVQPLALDLRSPGVDIAPCAGERLLLPAHMMDERTAAALAGRSHDLDAEAAEQRDGGGIDPRIEDRLGAAGQDRDAAAPGAGGKP